MALQFTEVLPDNGWKPNEEQREQRLPLRPVRDSLAMGYSMEAKCSSSDEYQHDFTAGRGRREVKWQNSVMELTGGKTTCRETEDLHIFLCDLRIYFRQTRGDC